MNLNSSRLTNAAHAVTSGLWGSDAVHEPLLHSLLPRQKSPSYNESGAHDGASDGEAVINVGVKDGAALSTVGLAVGAADVGVAVGPSADCLQSPVPSGSSHGIHVSVSV